jgi:hypothetical protein
MVEKTCAVCFSFKANFCFCGGFLISVNKTRNGAGLVRTWFFYMANEQRPRHARTHIMSADSHLTHKIHKILEFGWDTGTIVISPFRRLPRRSVLRLHSINNVSRLIHVSISIPIFVLSRAQHLTYYCRTEDAQLLDGKIVATLPLF